VKREERRFHPRDSPSSKNHPPSSRSKETPFSRIFSHLPSFFLKNFSPRGIDLNFRSFPPPEAVEGEGESQLSYVGFFPTECSPFFYLQGLVSRSSQDHFSSVPFFLILSFLRVGSDGVSEGVSLFCGGDQKRRRDLTTFFFLIPGLDDARFPSFVTFQRAPSSLWRSRRSSSPHSHACFFCKVGGGVDRFTVKSEERVHSPSLSGLLLQKSPARSGQPFTRTLPQQQFVSSVPVPHSRTIHIRSCT